MSRRRNKTTLLANSSHSSASIISAIYLLSLIYARRWNGQGYRWDEFRACLNNKKNYTTTGGRRRRRQDIYVTLPRHGKVAIIGKINTAVIALAIITCVDVRVRRETCTSSHTSAQRTFPTFVPIYEYFPHNIAYIIAKSYGNIGGNYLRVSR